LEITPKSFQNSKNSPLPYKNLHIPTEQEKLEQNQQKESYPKNFSQETEKENRIFEDEEFYKQPYPTIFRKEEKETNEIRDIHTSPKRRKPME
jgi:hypothetical protein